MFQMPVIEVSSTVAAVLASSGAISAGASVAGTAAGWAGMPHSVTFKLELENYTNEHLKVFVIFFLAEHMIHFQPGSGVTCENPYTLYCLR